MNAKDTAVFLRELGGRVGMQQGWGRGTSHMKKGKGGWLGMGDDVGWKRKGLGVEVRKRGEVDGGGRRNPKGRVLVYSSSMTSPTSENVNIFQLIQVLE